MLLWLPGAVLGATRSYFETVGYVLWTRILIMFWMVFVVQFHILTLAVLLARTPSLLKRNMFWRVLFLVKLFKIWNLSLT